MAEQRYDAIFVGNGLTSLVSAATLAKKGKSVLLLDDGESVDRKIPSAVFRFALGPSLYFGYEKWGAMEGFFLKLAVPLPSLQNKGFLYQKPQVMLQVILPSHRINLYSDESSYFDELKREFGAEAEKLKTLFNQIEREASFYYPYIGQFQQIETGRMTERVNEWKKKLDFSQAIQQLQKRTALELLDPYNFPPEITAYFNLLFLWAFKKTLEDVSAYEMIQLFSSLQEGGVCFREGDQTITQFFHQNIEKWGGTILKGQKISSVDIEKKRVERLSLSEGSTFKSPHFIVTRPSEKNSLSLFFEIPQTLVPPPMKETLIMTWGGDIPLGCEDIIVIRLKTHKEVPEVSRKIRLIATTVLLRDDVPVSAMMGEQIKKKVLDRLYALMPFSQSKIRSIDLPIENTQALQNPFFSQGESDSTQKEVLKGVFNYLQPKDKKNVYLVNSERSEDIGWGTAFLAGDRLAQIIEKSK